MPRLCQVARVRDGDPIAPIVRRYCEFVREGEPVLRDTVLMTLLERLMRDRFGLRGPECAVPGPHRKIEQI